MKHLYELLFYSILFSFDKNHNSIDFSMTSNQSQLPSLNIPPTIRDLNELQTPPSSLGLNIAQNLSNTNAPLSLPENYAIQFELKSINRQVNKIAEKQKYLGLRPQLSSISPLMNSSFSAKELNNDIANITNIKNDSSEVSKYNYYGHGYRFESKKTESNAEKILQQKDNNQKEELNYLHSPNKMNINKRHDLEVPDSQSYYIYFDEPNKSALVNSVDFVNQPNLLDQKKSDLFKNRIYHSQQLNDCQKYSSKPNFISYPEDSDQARTPPVHVFSKKQPQSKWVLQKKVKKLEKQLLQLKKKQNQREKLKNFTNNQDKKDSKVYVGKQVDQLINSLWP